MNPDHILVCKDDIAMMMLMMIGIIGMMLTNRWDCWFIVYAHYDGYDHSYDGNDHDDYVDDNIRGYNQTYG